MEHKKHISNIIKLGLYGFGVCVLILMYAFLLSVNHRDPVLENKDQVTPNKVYTNTEYGFQMSVMQQMDDHKGDEPDAVSFYLVNKNLNISISGNITPHAVLEGVAFDKAIDGYKMIDDYLVTESDQVVTVDGLHGRLLKVSGAKNQPQEIMEGYRLFLDDVKNDRVYLIFSIFEKKLPDEYEKKTLDSMLSFKLLK